MVTAIKKNRLVPPAHKLPEEATSMPMWVEVKQPIHRLLKALSNVVAFEEDAIFKSKDWPYAWPRKK